MSATRKKTRVAPPPHLRTETDEARDFRAWLQAAGVQFDEAPRPSRSQLHRGNGIVRGRADFLLVVNGRQCAIELKRADGGEVREAQVAWLRGFRVGGGLTAVCFGAQEAIEQVKEWMRK